MTANPWTIAEGEGPLVATAIHNGHGLRTELERLVKAPSHDRLREEDPYTGEWTHQFPTRVVVHQSRFEVELNRPRDRCVYSGPVDAWGLELWREQLPSAVVARSAALWDDFYEALGGLVEHRLSQESRVLVLDLHSYCHRRVGPDAPADPPEENPELNIGTGTMDRAFWAPVVDRFISALLTADRASLDVRENVKFRGGYMARWLHERFPRRVCVLSVEARKSFMDEWTGRLDTARHAVLGESLGVAAMVASEALGIPT